MRAVVNQLAIHMIAGDIYQQEADALVVMTDPNLSVDPRLQSMAGSNLTDETIEIGWCEVGKAVITSSGRAVNFSNIVHLVAPRWGQGSERARLGTAVWECLNLIEDHALTSVVFPAISTGLYGYPVESSANIMITRILDYTFESLEYVKSVTVCLEDEFTFSAFKREFEHQLDDLRHSGEATVS